MHYRFEPFLLDAEAGVLHGPEGEVKLRPQAFRLLLHLLRSPSRVVSRDELLDEVWGAEHLSSNSLPQVISELRHALNDSAQNPLYIQTIHRRGYRFVGELTAAAQPGAAPVQATATATATAPALPPEQPIQPILPSSPDATYRPALSKVRPLGGLLLGLVLLVVLTALVPVSQQWLSRGDQHTAQNPAGKYGNRLAVLAFRNVSGNPQQAWLGPALADTLASELGKSLELRVLDGQSISRMHADLQLAAVDTFSPATLERIRDRLGVRWVVMGAYAPAGAQLDQLQVRLRLQETSSHAVLEDFSSTVAIGQWLSAVVHASADLRRVLQLPPPDVLRSGVAMPSAPTNQAAAPAYFQALAALRRFDAQSAHASLQEAVQLDPDSALAHDALAGAYALLGYEQQAREQSARAVTLTGALAPVQRLPIEARHHQLEGRPAEAAALYRAHFEQRGESIAAGLPLADALMRAGQGRAASDLLRRLREKSLHTSSAIRIELAAASVAESTSNFQQQVQQARQAGEWAREIDARLWEGHAYLQEGRGLRSLGEAQQASGMLERARDLLLSHGDRHAGALATGALGEALADSGSYEAARTWVSKALEIAADIGNRAQVAAHTSRLGAIALYAGDRQAASDLQREAVQIFQALGDRRGAAGARLKLADVLARQGEVEQARELIASVRTTYQQIGDRHGEARAWDQLGVVVGRSGGLDARRHFERALELYREVGDPRGEADALGHVASTWSAYGQLEKAGELFSQALEIYRRIPSRKGSAKVMYNLSLIYLKTGRVDEASALLNESYRNFLEIDERMNACWAQRKLGDVQMRQGRLASARVTLEAALALSREVGSRSAEGHALTALGDLAAHEGDLPAAVALHEQARELRIALEQNGNAAFNDLALARMALQQEDLVRAGRSLKRAGEALALNRQGWRAVQQALMARLHAARRQAPLARTTLQGAQAALVDSESQDVSLKLSVKLEHARVLAALQDVAPALGLFSEVISQASEQGFVATALSARLEHLSLITHGVQYPATAPTPALRSLVESAKQTGFLDIARRADELLENIRDNATQASHQDI